MRIFTALLLILVAVSTDAKKHRTGKLRSKLSQEHNEMLPQIEFKRNNDPRQDRYMQPVPFGHIFKEGFDDPRSDYKLPIDALELNSRYVKDGQYTREFIKKHPNKYVVLNDELAKELTPTLRTELASMPPGFDREEFHRPSDGGKRVNDTIRQFWNIEGILARNLEEPPRYRLGEGRMPRRQNIADVGPPNRPQHKMDYFSKQNFELLQDVERLRKENFTSCDEFGKRAKFHPDDIVNLDWVPFYIWSVETTGIVAVSRVHQFSFPTIKFVKQFKETYDPLLNKTVDWEEPKLMLKTDHMQMLLIAVNRSGLFDAIPYIQLPDVNNWMKISTIPVRLKIVDPYLALMYCDEQYAVVMAVSGTEPDTPRKCYSEAATLKLKGRGFPVARDRYTEEREARAKAAALAEMEQSKLIFVEK